MPNSPLTVQLQPGPVCLKGLQVTEALTACFAGEEKSICIVTLDSCNNEAASDGSAQVNIHVLSQEGNVTGTRSLYATCMPTKPHIATVHARYKWFRIAQDQTH